jgi:hypothetical protein
LQIQLEASRDGFGCLLERHAANHASRKIPKNGQDKRSIGRNIIVPGEDVALARVELLPQPLTMIEADRHFKI